MNVELNAEEIGHIIVVLDNHPFSNTCKVCIEARKKLMEALNNG